MTFVGYLIFFFVALVSSFAVETLIPEREKLGDDLQNELRDIRSRLDGLAKGSD